MSGLNAEEVERLFINIGSLRVAYETDDASQHVSITPVLFDTDNGSLQIVPLLS